MMYLVNEALLRLIKPLLALLLGAILYWIITGVLGEPGSAILALVCFVTAGIFILLVQEGII